MLITPDWPAPSNIVAATTTRIGGYSLPPYDEFNLGTHVGDDLENTLKNRERLCDLLKLPNKPLWLQQTHSATVINSTEHAANISADASYSQTANEVCAVLTADCLPILLCDGSGTQVAAIHAGWRGLANGIVANTLKRFHAPPAHILAWLGPAIGPQKFEVGDEVKAEFIANDPAHAAAFLPSENNRWLANLYQLATQQLMTLGVEKIYGGTHCTYTEEQRFFSYRRTNNTGRMATLIYFKANDTI